MPFEHVDEEIVPELLTREGEWFQQGRNNSLIFFGRDRAKKGPATIDDGNGNETEAGALLAVVGRHDPDGNPDLTQDDAYLYLSMKTDADQNLGLDKMKGGGGYEVKPNDPGSKAAILMSDHVRLVFRKDIKITFDDGSSFIHIKDGGAEIKIKDTFINVLPDKVVVDAKKVELGKDAAQALVLGNDFNTKIWKIHTHPTPVGMSGPPQPADLTPVLSKQSFAKMGG
jgi:hypothetical protein